MRQRETERDRERQRNRETERQREADLRHTSLLLFQIMYEIFTFGEKPYKEWTNGRVWLELQNGYRLPRPPACPQFVYEIMMTCWALVGEEYRRCASFYHT